MKKLIVSLLLLTVGEWLSGCAPAIRPVQINGYTNTAIPTTISPGASFFVIDNKEAQNPLLEQEIKGKIVKLLERRGFVISSFEKAEFYLLFSDGIGPGRAVAVPMPDYPYDWGYFPGYPLRRSYFFVGPFYPYYPSYAETLYDRWLLLNVVDGKYYRENQGAFRTIWVGEARSTGTSSDLRSAVNYLLTALFEQFGKDTGKAQVVELDEKDPRVKELER